VVKRGMLLAGLAAVVLQGCTLPDRGRDTAFGPDSEIGLRLQPSSRTMVEGEVTTIMANTENLLGRDAEIEWYAPGGEIMTEDNGRIARVRFNDPGTYSVSARLFVDGNLVRRDSVTIRVQELRR